MKFLTLDMIKSIICSNGYLRTQRMSQIDLQLVRLILLGHNSVGNCQNIKGILVGTVQKGFLRFYFKFMEILSLHDIDVIYCGKFKQRIKIKPVEVMDSYLYSILKDELTQICQK